MYEKVRGKIVGEIVITDEGHEVGLSHTEAEGSPHDLEVVDYYF